MVFCSDCVGAGPLGFGIGDEAPIYRWRCDVARLVRVADRTSMRNWLDGLAKACMHRLSFSEIVHKDGRSVVECVSVAR